MLFKATCFFTTLFCLAFFGRSSSPFSTFVVNGSVSRVHTEGQGGVDRATEGGWAIPRTLGSLSGCKRCIVSLLHSFLILRSACVANLQKLSLSDPLAPSCSRLSPKFSFPSASTSLLSWIVFLLFRRSSFEIRGNDSRFAVRTSNIRQTFFGEYAEVLTLRSSIVQWFTMMKSS